VRIERITPYLKAGISASIARVSGWMDLSTAAPKIMTCREHARREHAHTEGFLAAEHDMGVGAGAGRL
jgi:hypothetical protein